MIQQYPYHYIIDKEGTMYTYNSTIRERDRKHLLEAIAELEERLRQTKETLAALDNPYGSDGYFVDGDVLRFKMRYNSYGTLYTFACVRAKGLWYPTGLLGQKGKTAHTWKELCGVWKTYGVAPSSIEVMRSGSTLPTFQEPF